MPFRSKAQQRWMFATHPKMAKRWAKHTKDFKALPEHVDDETAEKQAALASILRRLAGRILQPTPEKFGAIYGEVKMASPFVKIASPFDSNKSIYSGKADKPVNPQKGPSDAMGASKGPKTGLSGGNTSKAKIQPPAASKQPLSPAAAPLSAAANPATPPGKAVNTTVPKPTNATASKRTDVSPSKGVNLTAGKPADSSQFKGGDMAAAKPAGGAANASSSPLLSRLMALFRARPDLALLLGIGVPAGVAAGYGLTRLNQQPSPEEEEEKLAGVFYRDREFPLPLEINEEGHLPYLAAERTQDPRMLTRLWSSPQKDVMRALSSVPQDTPLGSIGPRLGEELIRRYPKRYRGLTEDGFSEYVNYRNLADEDTSNDINFDTSPEAAEMIRRLAQAIEAKNQTKTPQKAASFLEKTAKLYRVRKHLLKQASVVAQHNARQIFGRYMEKTAIDAARVGHVKLAQSCRKLHASVLLGDSLGVAVAKAYPGLSESKRWFMAEKLASAAMQDFLKTAMSTCGSRSYNGKPKGAMEWMRKNI